MVKTLFSIIFLLFFSFNQAQNLITENFDVFPATWTKVNASVPAGANLWDAATSVQTSFFGGGTGAYNGDAATSYAFVNFNSTTGNNTINNWLITPVINLMNDDVISFYSSKGLSGGVDIFADNLQLRISTNGAATIDPVGSNGVGDFSELAIDINPTLSTTLYPNEWTQYSYTVTGLPAETACKIAFRYAVPNGGPLGSNSDQVAIDQFAIDRPVLSADVFFTTHFSIHPNPVNDILFITSKGSETIEKIEIIDCNGRLVYQSTITHPETVRINVSNCNSGVYFVKVQSESGIGSAKIVKN